MVRGFFPSVIKLFQYFLSNPWTNALGLNVGADTKDTITHEDGNEYPLIKLDISMTSHPFYTGKQMLVDTAGRIDKFKTRYSKKA